MNNKSFGSSRRGGQRSSRGNWNGRVVFWGKTTTEVIMKRSCYALAVLITAMPLSAAHNQAPEWMHALVERAAARS